jgi:hypothetical protein
MKTKLTCLMTEAWPIWKIAFKWVNIDSVLMNNIIDMPHDFDCDDMNKIKNNTIIGGSDDYYNQEDMLRNML